MLLRVFDLKGKLTRPEQKAVLQGRGQGFCRKKPQGKSEMHKDSAQQLRALIKYKMSLTPLLFLQTPAIQEFYYSGANVF